MPPYPLPNFVIQSIIKNKRKFNGVYSSNSLSKIKNGAHVIDPNE